jgi:hypothetical protein
MAPISMKKKTKGSISPGTSATGGLRQKSAMPSYRAVEKMARDIEEKYDRPADVKKFLDRSRKYQEGLRAGAVPEAGADGIMRLNLVNKGIKDAEGRTLLSMQSPMMTAVGPRNFGEFMRDVGGAAGDMLGAVGEKVMSGGVTGDLLRYLDDKITGTGQKTKRFVSPPGEKVEGRLDGILENLESSDTSGNPLFNITQYEPIRVSDMDPSSLTAEATGIEDVFNRIRQIQNLGSQYGLDNIQIDPFNLNKGIGYQNQFMYNDMPIDYGFSATPSGDFGFSLGLQY